MADEKKNPYEVLLQEIDNLKKDNESIRQELDEVRSFNQALLGRKSTKQESTDDTVIKEKFDKFLKGE